MGHPLQKLVQGPGGTETHKLPVKGGRAPQGVIGKEGVRPDGAACRSASARPRA